MERVEGAGSENSCLSTWVQPLTFHPPVSAECSSRPEPRAWQHSPQRWHAGRPHPSGFLSGTCWALGPVLLSLQARPRAGGREGGREREVSSSSVCHGLNTVASCWFKPFPSHPSRHPFQKPRRGAEKAGEQAPPARAVSFLPEFVFFTPASRSRHSPPLVGRRWGCFQGRCRAIF